MKTFIVALIACLISAQLTTALENKKPDFVKFTRAEAADLTMVIKPVASYFQILGFRKNAADEFPSDAAICYHDEKFKQCLDITCTNANNCDARQPTIFTTNTIDEKIGATLVRPLKAGTAPLDEKAKMLLIWTTYEAAKTPEEIKPDDASNKTYNIYEEDVPAVGASSAQVFAPAVIVALVASFLVLA